MKIIKRYNNVLHKLVFSYTLLTLILTFILGGASYIYFSHNYKNEVKKVHQTLLEHEKKTIENNILQFVQSLYIDLSTPQHKNTDIMFLANNPLQGNHIKLNNGFLYLRDIASYNNVVDSIHIFYENHNLILSSSFGIKYLAEEDRNFYKDMDWLKESYASEDISPWISTRQVMTELGIQNHKDIISYVRAYPFSYRASNTKNIITININERAISNIIKELSPDNYGDTFAIDTDGRIISHIDSATLYNNLYDKNYIQTILHDTKSQNSFVQKIDGSVYMVSYVTLKPSNWKLVNLTSIEQFYSNSAFIQRMLIIICLITIIIGFLLAIFFSSHIYRPLKTLTQRVKSLFNDAKGQAYLKENEYALIDGVINDLSSKVDKLKDTLKANQPLIKHNLVTSLLKNSIINQSELAKRLNMINLRLDQNHFTSFIIILDNEAMEHISIENEQFIKYDLIGYVEGFSNRENLFLGAEIDTNQIGVIVGSMDNSQKSVLDLAAQISSYCYSNFLIPLTVASGNTVTHPLKIHQSFAQAKTLLQYKYFMPDTIILSGNKLLDRENSIDEIPHSLIEEFRQNLFMRNKKMLVTSISTFIQSTKVGNYTARHCQQKLLELLNIVANYANENGYHSSRTGKESILSDFYMVRNIFLFRDWLIKLIEDIFTFIDKRNDSYTTETIEKVKKYIQEHLDEVLSLDCVADLVYLNSGYLSKVFKDETGINFTDYITKERMNKARELLITTDLNVEEISRKVGYNTSAYFIQKFKSIYGYTPKYFKRNHINLQ